MSNDRVYATLIMVLLTTSLAPSFTAVYLYRLGREHLPPATGTDDEFGASAKALFTFDNQRIDFDYMISLLNPENSTSQQGNP